MKSASGWIRRWVSVDYAHLEGLLDGSDDTSAMLMAFLCDLRKVPDLSDFRTAYVCEMARQNGFIYTWVCSRDAAAGETQPLICLQPLWCDATFMFLKLIQTCWDGDVCSCWAGQTGEIFIYRQYAAILDKCRITVQFVSLFLLLILAKLSVDQQKERRK